MMSLKCNVCSSAESWDKCSNTEMTCPSGMEERCLKVEYKYGETKSFTRTCGTKDYCDKDKNPTCNLLESVSGVECNVNCCEGDLCNAGSAAKISGIMLLACALAVLMFKGAWAEVAIRFPDVRSCHFVITAFVFVEKPCKSLVIV